MKKRKHQHYFKDLTGIVELDIYRLLRLYKITDQAIGHAIKKCMVAGGRGAGKDAAQDVRESIETLERWEELELEDAAIALHAARVQGGSVANPPRPAPPVPAPFPPAPSMQPPPPPPPQRPMMPAPAVDPNE